MSYPNDREFFRLQYPPAMAPTTMNGAPHRVVDIGEGGFRYALVTDGGPIDGATVKGVIEFADDDPLEVEGTVVRTQAGEVAVRCPARSILMRVIIREQQRVRRRFPFRT